MTDKELREAAREYEKSLLASLPEPEDALFSPAFERKMKKLICRVDHPVRYWLTRLLPVLLAAGIAIAAAVLLPPERPADPAEPPAPPPSAEPAEQFPVYRPTWLPEGCVLAREALYENEGMLVYDTPSGTQMTFLYAIGGNPAEGEDLSQSKEVAVGDNTGLFRLWQAKGDLNDLFWPEDEASFWLSAPFGEADMVKIAASVERETAP